MRGRRIGAVAVGHDDASRGLRFGRRPPLVRGRIAGAAAPAEARGADRGHRAGGAEVANRPLQADERARFGRSVELA